MTTTTQQPARNIGVSVESSSRYKDTSLFRTQLSGLEWGLWKSDKSISDDTGYSLYQVREVDIGRLDLISWNAFGTTFYWWMIAQANAIVDPVRDMIVGSFIKIPRRDVCDKYAQRSPT